MGSPRLKVLFFIDSFGAGGGQQNLLDLIKGLDKRRYHPRVVTLLAGGDMEPEARALLGPDLVCLKRRGKFDFLVL